MDLDLFRQPPAAYRPVAMWFLNHHLEDEELLRQVRAMAEGGVGGIQLAARTGLRTPYLSERWFEIVALVLEEARRHGMDLWLADEYPYPSGASGGEVILRHPEYRAWHMRATRLTAAPGETVRATAPGTVLLRACAVPLHAGAPRWDQAVPLESHTGIVQHQQVLFEPSSTYLTRQRYMANGPRPTLEWRAPAGPERWEVWLIAAAEIERYKFFGAYVDLCNPDAVRFFLDTTYQRYLDRLGPERFAQLSGFFVDESHPQSWSWHLPDFFQRRCGYDLLEALPALWTDVGPRTARVRYDYMQSVTELFVESFHKPLAEWCRGHGVVLSLEVGSTRNVVQRHADIPGIDPGHEKAGTPLDTVLARELPRFRANLTFPASLAAQTGKRRVLDELFHSVGWSLTLQDMKAMLDRAAARGANLFAFHAFCYTTGGLRKWDAPPSQFEQNPYWPHFPLLAAYAGRLGLAMSHGRRVAPIALVDPITSLWAHGEGIGAALDDVGKHITADWAYLMRELTAAQRPHDTVDPSLLAEASVEPATGDGDGNGNGGAILRLGEAEYRVLVLPPLTTLERVAWETLERFARAGGAVIACGLLPYEQIEPSSDVPERCAAAFRAEPHQLRAAYAADGTPGVELTRASGFSLLRTRGTLAGAAPALLDLLEELAPADLRVTSAQGAEAQRQLLLAQRRDGDETLYLLANFSSDEQRCDVTLRLPSPIPTSGAASPSYRVSRLDLETGESETLDATLDPSTGAQRLRLTFPAHGAHLLQVSPAAGAVEEAAGAVEEAAGAVEEAAVPPRDRPPSVAAPPAPPAPPEIALPLDGEWECEPLHDNALRLDRFRFALTPPASDSTPGSAPGSTPTSGTIPGAAPDTVPAALREGTAPLLAPRPLVNLLRDLAAAGRSGGSPLPVEVVPAFGALPTIRPALPLTAWYLAAIDVERMPERAALCLDEGVVEGTWSLWLNGQEVPPAAFARRHRWDLANREADITPLLRPGRNELLLRVDAREPWDGLVDALYLLGDFGVAHAPDGTPLLTAPPARVRWNALAVGSGSGSGPYPYFAGTLRLQRTVDLPTPQGSTAWPPDGHVRLRLPDRELMFAGVAQLAVNGRALGVRPWAPYAWDAPPGVLAPGANTLTLSITTTLIGLFEGHRYDPHLRQPVPLLP